MGDIKVLGTVALRETSISGRGVSWSMSKTDTKSMKHEYCLHSIAYSINTLLSAADSTSTRGSIGEKSNTNIVHIVHRYIQSALSLNFSEGQGSQILLPRSGTRTLKLCRRGEPGIFSQ